MPPDFRPLRRPNRNRPLEATPETGLTPRADAGKRLQRNAGAISLILDKVRSDLEEAIEKEGFHGNLRFTVELVDQDLMIFEDSHGQRFKLK